jgi:hypothetical protein
MSTKNKTNLSHHNESVKTLENTLEKVMLGGGESKLKKEAERANFLPENALLIYWINRLKLKLARSPL